MKVSSYSHSTGTGAWRIDVTVAEDWRCTEVFVDVLKKKKNGKYGFMGNHDTAPLYLMQKISHILESLQVERIDRLHLKGIHKLHSETYRVNFSSRLKTEFVTS
ncbi:hypothetical protein ACTHOQ_09395 [Solibacillus silvestris]|uniref:hypothetical protein n=1 Tax=Solibacillus silvestris TaxID=76853 RepID=UPI003F7F1492